MRGAFRNNNHETEKSTRAKTVEYSDFLLLSFGRVDRPASAFQNSFLRKKLRLLPKKPLSETFQLTFRK